MARVFNFNPGPSAIPLPALERARDEFLDFEGSGMSIMEHSHRGKVYEAVHNEALSLVRRLLNVPETHDILFLQGGATQQFAQIPMNLRTAEQSADYITTGVWGIKAIKEARLTGKAKEAATTIEGDKFYRVPKDDEIVRDPEAAYLHLTSNNTVMGTQFHQFPENRGVPLICDMSSDIMARPIDVSQFGMIYAGAQKNMGPSGITMVIMDKKLIEGARKDVPYIFQYRTHQAANSLANTVPTFAVYMLRNVLAWLESEGGVAEIFARNQKKAAQIYSVLEERPELFRLTVEKSSRSFMNVVWNMPSEDEDKACVEAATAAGLVGLKGHKIVGGLRASIYNAVGPDAVDALCEFLHSYRK